MQCYLLQRSECSLTLHHVSLFLHILCLYVKDMDIEDQTRSTIEGINNLLVLSSATCHQVQNVFSQLYLITLLSMQCRECTASA